MIQSCTVREQFQQRWFRRLADNYHEVVDADDFGTSRVNLTSQPASSST